MFLLDSFFLYLSTCIILLKRVCVCFAHPRARTSSSSSAAAIFADSTLSSNCAYVSNTVVKSRTFLRFQFTV